MAGQTLFSQVLYSALDFIGVYSFNTSASFSTSPTTKATHDPPITDLTLSLNPSTTNLLASVSGPRNWHRIGKDLYIHTGQRHAWLEVEQVEEEDLTPDDLVVVDIKVGDQEPPAATTLDEHWEGRPCGLWLKRRKSNGDGQGAVTAVNVLFGLDAVDPRPHWTLMPTPLLLDDTPPGVPVARLNVRHTIAESTPGSPPLPLRTKEDGTFKIVQISDAHMVTGVGVCKDAIDADGKLLPPTEADPLTVDFMGRSWIPSNRIL